MTVSAAAIQPSILFAQTDTAPKSLPVIHRKFNSAEDAVALGMVSALEVRSAEFTKLAARAETESIRSQSRVQVSSNSYLSGGNESSLLYNAGGPSQFSVMAVPQRLFGEQNFTAMAPIFTGGRTQSLIHAAVSREKAADHDQKATASDTALHIRDTFFRAQFASAAITATNARLDAGMELLRIAKAQFEAGKGLQSSISRIESEIAEAQRMVTSAINLRRRALLDIATEIGVSPASDLEISAEFTPEQISGDLNSSIREALAHRSELSAAADRQDSAQHLAAAAIASQRPQVYGMAMADGSLSDPSGTHTGFTVGVVVSIPILDGGQRHADINQARWMQRKAEIDQERIRLQIETEVRSAWLDIGTAKQNLESARAEVTSAESSYEIAVVRAKNQKGLLVEVLDALSALTQARNSAAQATYDLNFASAELKHAIGSDTRTNGRAK